MATDQSTSTHDLFDRVIRGDELAGRQLTQRQYDRLLLLTRVILGDFPELGRARSAESVLHEAWIDLDKVGELQDDEREVFDLHSYDGLTQAEIAQVLGLSPKKISRLWISAMERLAEAMPELAEFRWI